MIRRTPRAAFTLVELLVVIGIIAVLIGILLPALSRARSAAREVRSASGLRQMLVGYTLYHQDNKGSLLFGYTPASVNGGAVTAFSKRSGQTFGVPVADRYPWRLLPYVAGIWPVIHAHADLPPQPAPGDSAADAFGKAYTLSLNPTYGINSVYVGGDKNFDGFVAGRPNAGKHVVFKASEVRRSSQLIVFADSRAANVPSLAGQGLHYLTPPRAAGQNWTVVNKQFKVLTGSIAGIPQGWFTRRAVVGFFDGHVDLLPPADLEDMRLWANRAESADYDYAP